VQDEIDRLEVQQRVFNLIFDDRLIFPPLHHPRRVLDCGFGAGTWAVEVAEQFPNCQVESSSTIPRVVFLLTSHYQR
jgi:ubiquinone/menaquinone biosynthesis C-methylase UbiE